MLYSKLGYFNKMSWSGGTGSKYIAFFLIIKSASSKFFFILTPEYLKIPTPFRSQSLTKNIFGRL